MKVLTFGELLLRLSSPGYEKLFQSDVFRTSFCGGEANVAVSLANFGLDSCFVTKLPNTDVGKAAMHSLDYFNVDTSNIILGDGRMGLYYLEKGASQRPSKIIYDRAFSSIACANPTEFDWDKLFNKVNWFHWTGIDPALSTNVYEIILSACKKAKAKGIVVSCDLNYRKKLWSSEEAQKSMKTLMSYVDVCVANEEDVQMSLGIEIKNNDVSNAKLNIEGYKQLAKIMIDTYGFKYVAFTLRESYSASLNGWSALLYHNGKSYLSKSYDINLVDRVGGGDSFAAGLIYGLATRMNDQDAIEFAVAASCLKQTIEGDFNRSTVEEVLSLAKSSGSGRIER